MTHDPAHVYAALYLLAGACFCWAMYARSIRRERKRGDR